MTENTLNYHWEAETASGEIITKGGDLLECVRFSLIPNTDVALPRHDIAGVEMIRRFGRAFHQTKLNIKSGLPGKIFWKNGSLEQVTSEDLREIVKPGDFIGKGVAGEQWYLVRDVKPDRVLLYAPYVGKSKPQGMFGRIIKWADIQPGRKYLHVVVCKGFRMYVNDDTGAVLITPGDKEVYL